MEAMCLSRNLTFTGALQSVKIKLERSASSLSDILKCRKINLSLLKKEVVTGRFARELGVRGYLGQPFLDAKKTSIFRHCEATLEGTTLKFITQQLDTDKAATRRDV